MKKVILNFENMIDNFKELVQEALNRNFLDFLVSHETFKEFEKIERITLYSKNPKTPTKYLVYYDKDILIYLCMESPEVWEKTLGYLPLKEEKLNLIFKDSVLG